MSLDSSANIVLVLLFLGIIGSTIWLGLWNNIITFCNFVIAALAAHGLWPIVNVLFKDAPENIQRSADLISVWGTFILTTVVLRVITDSLSSVRLRFHPAIEWTGRSLVCTALALCFVMFTCNTLQYSFVSGPIRLKYQSHGGGFWERLAEYWMLGPFAF